MSGPATPGADPAAASDPARVDPVFGLRARVRSGAERGDEDVVWADEVLLLVRAAAGDPSAAPGARAGRLVQFGLVDREGAITKAGRAFLRDNAAAIIQAVTRAVLPTP